MKKLFAIILVGLFMPIFCFGAVNYDRNPSGYYIKNPVIFSVSFDNFIDICPTPTGRTHWKIEARGTNYWSPKYASTTKNVVWEKVFPVGTSVDRVRIICLDIGENYYGGADLEYNAGNDIFEIVEYDMFFTGGTAVGDTTGVITDLFAGLGPFLWAFMGIPLGFVVVKRIIKIIPK